MRPLARWRFTYVLYRVTVFKSDFGLGAMWCDSTIFNYYSQAVVVAKPFDLRYFWARKRVLVNYAILILVFEVPKHCFVGQMLSLTFWPDLRVFKAKNKAQTHKFQAKTIISLFSKISFFTKGKKLLFDHMNFQQKWHDWRSLFTRK